MNHRLRFRWVSGTGLELVDVWCPADHGGTCDAPEVDDEEHDENCDLIARAAEIERGEVDDECTCDGYAPTGRC